MKTAPSETMAPFVYLPVIYLALCEYAGGCAEDAGIITEP